MWLGCQTVFEEASGQTVFEEASADSDLIELTHVQHKWLTRVKTPSLS